MGIPVFYTEIQNSTTKNDLLATLFTRKGHTHTKRYQEKSRGEDRRFKRNKKLSFK